MVLNNAVNMVCDYISYLHLTGRESACEVWKLVLLPLLDDMLEGDLQAYEDTDSRNAVEKYCRDMYDC